MVLNDIARYGPAAKFSNYAPRQRHVSAIVVGGGAAGIAVLGKLLERIDSGGKIAWVDTEFKGGRINKKYREVPSNTKVGLFLTYARATKPFREIIEATPTPNAITALEELPQDGTCSLYYAGDMLQALSDGLVKHERVELYQGRVTEANWDDANAEWSLSIREDGQTGIENTTAPLLVYCTGSSPTTVSLPTPPESTPEHLDIDIALKPSALTQFIPMDKEVTVGVIGASHSAILILMNLFKLTQSTHPHLRVRWFARSSALRYAVYKDGWILYDNTGLKGEAAKYARENLDGDKLLTSDAGKVITRVDCSGGDEQEKEAMLRELPGCDYVVEAIGFTRDPLPAMNREIQFDHDTGGFVEPKTGKAVTGLYGCGIAFPERVVDKAGNRELAVGFFKFMKFLDRVLPAWVPKS
ncbi:pyridine nucleotide-disulfide oxidoreductase-domain-containing protein [Xylariales sp. PMI_506]|nr:pyridine nucleotide-disulfide oxidoreductase-domain-containing protein [Xylariales sp. PMI_506]